MSLVLGVVAVWAGLAATAAGQGSTAADRTALEAIYRATGGDDWTNNTSWLSNAPLEDWYGVEVTDGRVTGLRLGGWDETARRHVDNGLTGSLPAELGTLSQLRWVEITGNSGLTGRIPVEVGNLARLESLSLQANWLTGSIPAALGRLTELDFLGLEGNALTGSIPAELGNLSRARLLGLSGNPLTGRLPPEFGNLTSLAHLGLSYTMLSGPLPESLTGLLALERLDVDGSGLCVPDTAAMQAWAAAIADFTGVVCEGVVSFTRMVTPPGLGRLDSLLAVVDLNGDGRDDIVAGKHQEQNVSVPEERLEKTPVRVFVGEADGGFRHAPELVEGTIEARIPIVVADDFNGDGRTDLAVFDYGVYIHEQSVGVGNPPQLFLSGPDGRLRPSEALADAVRREHEQRPELPKGISGPADLHLKSATSGDIDGDGDTDLWVESTGGKNVESHFMVNGGDGTFTIEPARATNKVLRNNPPDYWRHVGNELVDLDNDGDLDLALGQIRGLIRISAFSIALLNDGTGHYPVRIELPHPPFNDGYTDAPGLTHFDVNGDAFQDLLLLHRRNGDGPPNRIPGTGRYIQVLVNRGGTGFVDDSRTWMGDQSTTTPERNTDGDPLFNEAEPVMHDVDRDGCPDLVMSRGKQDVRPESPLVYRNDGRGRFAAMSPVPFAGSARYFGNGAVPADVNGDGAIDFVVPYTIDGPDREHGTADDFGMLVTLLNTTPVGPIRCGDPANRPPAPAGTLPNRTLPPDGTLTVDVSRVFVDPDGDALTYTVSSSVPHVVAAGAAGARVTLTAVGEGTATIRVTATDPGGLSAIQSFTVTVSTTVSGSFTDDPLQPGVTPVKAVHFTELRTRIDALRAGTGLRRFAWTDPVLRAGVTPVRRVHVLELRQALAEAYSASGRAAPRWTDASPAAGTIPIRALHVTELRAAVLALE